MTRIVLLVLVALIAWPASASAAGWIAPVALGPGIDDPAEVSAAMGTSGDAAIAWSDQGRVWVALKPAGQPFGAPIDLAPGVSGGQPVVGVDALGGTIVAWSSTNNGTTQAQVKVALRPPDGSFGAPVLVSDPVAGTNPPQLAMNPAGDAVVAWGESLNGGATWQVRAAQRAAGQPMQNAITAAAGVSVSPQPDVAIDATGFGTIVWRDGAGIQSATGSPTVPYVPATVATAANLSAPVVATGHSGPTVVAWQAGLVGARIFAATRADIGDPFSGSTQISSTTATAPAIGATGNGVATVAWPRPAGGPFSAISGVTYSLGAFSSEFDLSPLTEFSSGTSIAGGGSGMTFASWIGSFRVRAAIRPNAGAFGASTQLSDPAFAAFEAAAAADGNDNGLVAWDENNGAGIRRVSYAGYDGTPPVISTITVPSTGFAGEAIPMSVDAFDEWGTTASWDFGDGSPAGSGASTSHAYAAPGDYDVVVTVTDPVGQSAVAFPMTVQVTPAPPPLPGATATTGEAAPRGDTEATLRGTLSAGAFPVQWWFEYGPTSAYGATTPASTARAGTVATVLSDVAGLTGGTTYHYRLVARGAAGTATGADRTFVTGVLPVPPPLPPPTPLVPAASADANAPRLFVGLSRSRMVDGGVVGFCRTVQSSAVGSCRIRVVASGTSLGSGLSLASPPKASVPVGIVLNATGQKLAGQKGGVAVTLRASATLSTGRKVRATTRARLRP